MTVLEYIEKIRETYRLIGVLSEKNGSKILRLRHKTMEREIVLRCYERPVPAYEALVSLRAENLPEIYDVVTLEDGQAVLEEYIDGLTVAEVMAAGRYRYRGARQVLRGVCTALSVLHARNLVHRDVKPENIVIQKDGRVVLLDFNASRRMVPGKRDTEVLGTVGYAPPEQMGLTGSDARADLYAVGVLLNVMLTGLHPSEKMASGKAGRIVRKCTHVHPGDRYQTAESLVKAL